MSCLIVIENKDKKSVDIIVPEDDNNPSYDQNAVVSALTHLYDSFSNVIKDYSSYTKVLKDGKNVILSINKTGLTA